MSAITKLHSSQGFEENVKIETVMNDYMQSKHADVQQIAIEYMEIKKYSELFENNGKDLMLNTPLNEN